ncbi:MAG: dCTP deaminase [Candidatus Aenigmarchaeota archaeon]|nr:dCTP deaminase [Candidatus Aenigmarchaeota archaeon]MDW8149066.1 dCTP deaminase [Candidatus Aenigmarchaeota archaeon]
MSVLSREKILELIKKREIIIEPFRKSQVGPASVDLHLGNKFRLFSRTTEPFRIKESSDYREITQLIEVENNSSLLILPGELVTGITLERVKIPNYICGRIEGRSRFARTGLLVHLSSGFIQPGSDSKIVLEIVNLSPIPLALTPRTKVCQIIFETLEGTAKYKGKFQYQKEP